MPSTPPEPRDPALGVCETLLADGGRIQALGAHLGRLARSALTLYGVSLPAGLAGELRGRVRGLPGPHRVRVDLRPGAAEIPSTEITLIEAPADAPGPVACALLEWPGGLGPHKLADRRGLEAPSLITDASGELLEASWGSVWVLEDGQSLTTPPPDRRLLAGITRRLLLHHARELGFTARVEPIHLDRARRADGILVTSAVRRCVSVTLADAAEAAEPIAAAEMTAARIRAGLDRIAWE